MNLYIIHLNTNCFETFRMYKFITYKIKIMSKKFILEKGKHIIIVLRQVLKYKSSNSDIV